MEYENKMRNPDGKFIEFQKALKEWKEWNELINFLKKEIKCRIIGFDPDILIQYENRSINLPVSFVRRLKQIMKG